MTVHEVEARVQAEVDEGLFATGGQLYVSQHGEPVIDLAMGADGLAADVHADMLFATYCSGKPAVALAIAGLVDDRELSLDDHLGDLLEHDLHPGLRPVLVAELLNHTAGLHEVDPHAYLLSSAQQAEQMVFGTPPPPGWMRGRDVAYSQVSAWNLLASIIEAMSGFSARDYVAKRVLEPVGVTEDMFVVGMDDSQYDAHMGRFGVNVFLSGATATPILTERTRRFRCRADASLGTTASARGLGRFYEALLVALRSDDSFVDRARLEQFIAPQSRGFDPSMTREAGYGFGFMVGLEDHYFGRCCSPSAFGHSANGGMTAGFADPAADLVIAFHFTGRIDADSAIVYRRPSLVNQIYRAVLGIA